MHLHSYSVYVVFFIPLLVVFVKTSIAKDVCISKGDDCPEGERKKSLFEQDRQDQEQSTESQENELISSTGMEWFSHGVNNNDLVSQLKNGRIVKTAGVEAAMREVDRGNYCTNRPYQDSPQYIGYGITISAPHMHAHALEMLKDKLVEGASVLDVGSGQISCVFCSNCCASQS